MAISRCGAIINTASAVVAQLVVHLLGKQEVTSSSLVNSSKGIGLKPCMAAMCTLRKHQTRGEAIIRRRDGSLEIQIVKAGVLRSDTSE